MPGARFTAPALVCSQALFPTATNSLDLRRRVGFPIVNTGCQFFRPCHLGDLLVLEVAHLGGRSIEFSVRGRVGDEEKFHARHKVVPSDYRQHNA